MEPGSLWPQLWSESESSSLRCRAWINRAHISFSTKKKKKIQTLGPVLWCVSCTRLQSPNDPVRSWHLNQPHQLKSSAFWMANRQLRLVAPMPRTPKPCFPCEYLNYLYAISSASLFIFWMGSSSIGNGCICRVRFAKKPLHLNHFLLYF